MGVTIKTVKNDFPKMEKELNNLNGKKVKVGVLGGGEQAWLAAIHEYGCNIQVTPKMRAWLHANGLHLKASTTEIHIPERSFLRSGYDTNIGSVLDETDRLVGFVGSGKMSADEFCKTVGLLLADRIKEYATELDSPAKHPFTLQRNGGKANPLIDSGDMIGAISYEVE